MSYHPQSWTSARPEPKDASPRQGVDVLDARLAVALGALAIAMTAILVVLADTSSTTATVFRCVLALPILVVLAAREHRRRGASALGAASEPASSAAAKTVQRAVALWSGWWPSGRWHLLAGALLGADMVFWNESIANSGAGISTVLVNVQVVVVPLLTLVIFGERIARRFWMLAPVLLCGVGVAGGVFQGDAYGARPLYGTVAGVLAGITYAGYLVILRRADSTTGRMTMLTGVTVAAGVVGACAGVATGTLDLTPPLSSLGWLLLLAISGQIVGWVLVASGLRRLAASTGAVLLLLQPAAAVIMGVIVLSEQPSVVQLAGCAIVLLAVAATAYPLGAGRRGAPSSTEE